MLNDKKTLSHGGETGFRPPDGVSIEQVPDSTTLANLLDEGKIDAIMPSTITGIMFMLNKAGF